MKDPLPAEKKAVFNRGHKVGILAQQLFPGGVDVSPDHVFKYAESVEKTKELIAAGEKIIYEAAFIFDDTLVALDILVKEDEKWFAYEVKSSLKISQAYVMDAALQYYIIKNCLPGLEDISLVNLNEKYCLEDQLDVKKLFKITSVKKDAEKNGEFIKHHIALAKNTFYKNELPSVAIGQQCFSPYACDFMGTCWKNTAANNVFEFSGISKKQAGEWLAKGFLHINEIPDEEVSGTTQKLVRSFKDNLEIFEKENVKEFFKKISYPLAFLDMEFYTPAIPKYKGNGPFELSPFLFSCAQIDKEGGSVTEQFFFHEENSNPEKDFMEHLIALAKNVSCILVFDTGQEVAAMNTIVKHYPEYKKAVEEIKKKFIDLADVFTNFWYYHPQQKGSTSLKKIHQSIFTKDMYADLPVNSGLLASYGYDDFLNETDIFKKQELKENLIAYCQADTRAVLELTDFLRSKIQE
ncbi:MAG TPA: DUF2779 domain-containing protein [Bacteroidia bacterium]|nr:DUF2779 domain-containing protein [Bacteroidia bacterium]